MNISATMTFHSPRRRFSTGCSNAPFKARRTSWNKTEIKHWNCFSLISERDDASKRWRH